MKPSTPAPDVVLAATTVAVVRQIGHMAGSCWAVMTVTAWVARFRHEQALDTHLAAPVLDSRPPSYGLRLQLGNEISL